MNKISRVKELVNLLNKASDDYYNSGYTIMSDEELAISFEGFRKGAKWADEHPNRWISVEDRLPEQNKKVIVICEKLDTAPFYKISLGHIVDKTICKDNYNGWDIPNVVYWTPMPKLPEEI